MISANIKRVLLCSTIVLSAALAGPAPAFAQDPREYDESDIMYDRKWYSDDTYTTVVGHERDTCHYYGVGGSATQGYYTDYPIAEPIAYCVNGYMYPY